MNNPSAVELKSFRTPKMTNGFAAKTCQLRIHYTFSLDAVGRTCTNALPNSTAILRFLI